jgi:hypothetical protein
MSIDTLTAAAERLQRSWGTLQTPDPDQHDLIQWALLLWDTRPIDEQWLRETWETYGGRERLYVKSPVDICFVPATGLLWISGTREVGTRGRLTALMFGLGQFPITKGLSDAALQEQPND